MQRANRIRCQHDQLHSQIQASRTDLRDIQYVYLGVCREREGKRRKSVVTPRCAHRTAQTDPSRRRSPLAAASPFCSRVPHNSRVEEAGPRHVTHALARADPRAALTARPARSRRFGGKGAQRRSASSAAGAGGGGSPPPQRASTRRCAAARARRRVRALARRSVSSFFR